MWISRIIHALLISPNFRLLDDQFAIIANGGKLIFYTGKPRMQSILIVGKVRHEISINWYSGRDSRS